MPQERDQSSGLVRRGDALTREESERLPYRYRASLTVEIVGDGIHADGNGARATVTRLARTLAADPMVVKVSPIVGSVEVLRDA